MVKFLKSFAHLLYVSSWTVLGCFAAFFMWSILITIGGC